MSCQQKCPAPPLRDCEQDRAVRLTMDAMPNSGCVSSTTFTSALKNFTNTHSVLGLSLLSRFSRSFFLLILPSFCCSKVVHPRRASFLFVIPKCFIKSKELVLIVSDGWVSMRRIGPNSSCVLLLISLRRGVVGLLPAREGLKGLNNCCFTLQELGQTNS